MMGQQLYIDIYIHNRINMNQARNVVADMIKLYYLDGISTLDPKYFVYDSFLRKREMLRAYPDSQLIEEYPDCALKRLYASGNNIHIARCSDLQRYLAPVGSEYSGFFYSICFAIAREFPTIGFDAESRFLMTVTDHVENTDASYDTEKIIFKQNSYSIYHDDDYTYDSARWKMLPQCIAINGKSL